MYIDLCKILSKWNNHCVGITVVDGYKNGNTMDITMVIPGRFPSHRHYGYSMLFLHYGYYG